MTVAVTTLPNGLRVLTDSMPTVETVSLGAWVDVGTRHETADINGISHLLEHMAFKGTERRSAQDIAEEIENVGGHLNAYTSREQTAYYAKVLKEDMPLAVDIVSDILQHAVFDPEELKREQAVVIQEINQAIDTPDDIVFDHFQATAYPKQALGRPVLGTPETVRGIDRDTLHGFMRGSYTAPAMVVTAAGNIDHDAFVRQVEERFTGLKGAAAPQPERAAYTGGDYREARDLEQVHVVLGFDGVPYDHPQFYSTAVLSTLLGGGMSSRLFQEIRERRGLVYSIYSFASSYTDGGLFTIYAGTGEDEVAELIPVMCDEIVRVGDGVSEDELKRARAQLKAGILMSLESTSSRCEQLARQVLAYGRPLTTEEVVARIESVDANAVRDAVGTVLRGAPTLAVLGSLKNVEPYAKVKERLAA
ncbi:M16 family metallopeptidase [Novispirillum sp. DQ9]|uniref:M16 family metallopeptidase n=1 Tax=Novispirillum sp. DQ9 TaxID=3398612 RepID=UPI003C7EB27E